MTDQSSSLLAVRGVSKRFGDRRTGHLAVNNVELELKSGELLGIIGESGSGKSTLGRMMVGLDSPTEGTIELDGVSIGRMLSHRSTRIVLRRAVQFVGQDTSSSFDPLLTIRASLRQPATNLLGLSGKAADELVDETVAALELSPALADRLPHQLSGGQRQRFALARGLVVAPKFLVCDEVVSALDVSVQGAVLNCIKSYCRLNRAGLVFVSHGLPATAFIADRLVVMRHGRIVEAGTTRDVIEAPNHPYTRQLLAAYSGRATSPARDKSADRNMSVPCGQ
jgi:peptide/nickel transport system ATP-binding protein